jgi:hypothetical protein
VSDLTEATQFLISWKTLQIEFKANLGIEDPPTPQFTSKIHIATPWNFDLGVK